MILFWGQPQALTEQKKIHTFVGALNKEIVLHVIECNPQPMTLRHALDIAQSKQDAISRRRAFNVKVSAVKMDSRVSSKILNRVLTQIKTKVISLI